MPPRPVRPAACVSSVPLCARSASGWRAWTRAQNAPASRARMTPSGSSIRSPPRSDDDLPLDARYTASGAARAAATASNELRSSRAGPARGWEAGWSGEEAVPDEPGGLYGSAWPLPGACAESVTTTDAFPAVPRAHAAPGANGAARPHSTRCARRLFLFFFLRPHHDQHGMSQQGQCNVPIPGRPATYFIVIQSRLAFSLF